MSKSAKQQVRVNGHKVTFYYVENNLGEAATSVTWGGSTYATPVHNLSEARNFVSRKVTEILSQTEQPSDA